MFKLSFIFRIIAALCFISNLILFSMYFINGYNVTYVYYSLVAVCVGYYFVLLVNYKQYSNYIFKILDTLTYLINNHYYNFHFWRINYHQNKPLSMVITNGNLISLIWVD